MPERSNLDGKVVLVTGGSSGIGRAMARALAEAGADVALTYRVNLDGAGETAREVEALGRRCTVVPLDVADPVQIRGVGPHVRESLGTLDVWINNAGADVLTGGGAALSTVEKLDLLLSVDLRGTILASWAAAELFDAQAAGGVIINMSWDHVLTGMEGINPQMFAAVKGGVLAFSKSLARTVAPKVRVNVLAPGWIETSFASEMNAQDAARHGAIVEATPLKRWGSPEDVAQAAVFLASPAAAFLTGQTLLVGGGVVM